MEPEGYWKKMGFEKYVRGGKGRRSWLTDLEIGENYIVVEGYSKKLYQRIWQYEKKTGKEFEYLKCINGIVVRRAK